jgi:hypothetical protein
MTTTTTTAKKNPPAFEISYIDERRIDKTLAALLGRTFKADAVDTRWLKCGVGFNTQNRNVNFFIGDRTDPARKSYLMYFTSWKEQANANRETDRLPVADIILRNGTNDIDFKNDQVGVAFLNQDGSYTLCIGPRGEADRYQMRALPQPVVPSTRDMERLLDLVQKPLEKAAEPEQVTATPTTTPKKRQSRSGKAKPQAATTQPKTATRGRKAKPQDAAQAAA